MQGATRVGSLLNVYEGVREIVLSVAIKTVFTKNLVKNCGAPFGLSKCECLATKQLSLDTVHEMNLIELK
jgi:hypothetical protein